MTEKRVKLGSRSRQRRLACSLLILAAVSFTPLSLLPTPRTSAATTATVVYANDFEGSVGGEWSNTATDTTPVGARKFLGQFAAETVNLSLSGLPSHTSVRVEFDLYVIRSWDGNGNSCCGPDEFDLSVSGGPTLLHTTFSNTGDAGNHQAYPGAYPGSQNFARTGATESNSLGYDNFGDTVYHLERRFIHTGGSLVFAFSGLASQGLSDESWGLDNVTVTTLDEQCVAPPSGLVGWWPGDGNADDFVGTNNGSLENGATFAAGEVDQAFSLDGTNDYVRVPTSADLNPTGSFTLDAWIFPVADQGGMFIQKWGDTGDYSNQRAYNLAFLQGGRLNFAISDDVHQNDVTFHVFETPANSVTLNAWNHVAAVYDQSTGTRRIFINGVQLAERTDAPITLTNSAADFAIGAHQASSSLADGFFAGLIDEAEIYNRALSAAEIAGLFNAGSAGKCEQPPACITPPSGMVAWWPGDDDANDIAGGNNGTLHNGATFAAGMVGQAFSFDGLDDFVEVTDAASLNPPAITLDAWIKPNTIKLGSRIVSKDLSTSTCAEPYIVYALEARGEFGNRAAFFFTTSDNVEHILSGTSVIPTGTFSHVAATFDGQIASIYVNGVLENTISVSGVLTNSNAPVVIGNGGGGCISEFAGLIEFDGLIDEVEIFDRALTADEIAAICGAGAAGKCKVPSQPGAPCPRGQGHWKNNPDLWPVTSLTLGSETYTQSELLAILNTPVGTGKKADASLILADQLIAAKLNIANGSDPGPVSTAIDAADALLSAQTGRLRYDISASSETGQSMIDLASLLESYNKGELTPLCAP
jgi:hypothetical protein